jgi:repressor LexA
MNELIGQKTEFQEIFKNICGSLNLTAYRVAKDTGTAVTKWNSYLNLGTKPNYEAIRALMEAYPSINPRYLIYGQEPFLLDDTEVSKGFYNEVEYIDVPLLSSKFTVDVLDNHLRNDYESPNTYQVAKSLLGDGKYFVIEIEDSGMVPTLTHTTKAIFEQVDESEWGFVTGVVAILYRDYFSIRRIKNNDIESYGVLTMSSDNRDNGSAVVQRADIRQILKGKFICYKPLE